MQRAAKAKADGLQILSYPLPPINPFPTSPQGVETVKLDRSSEGGKGGEGNGRRLQRPLPVRTFDGKHPAAGPRPFNSYHRSLDSG